MNVNNGPRLYPAVDLRVPAGRRAPAPRIGQAKGDRGATAVEYALMVGLIALVIVGNVTAFGFAGSSQLRV